ncbi:hypothetical protein Q4488_18075 [Amphritea sp. 1_MG-2023]|uniref:hypothetical protein n=1 Tax=Amphritea sp. 1_MG-2023 TaxID=3062670 RepID=UPI0026E36104|nr:hypothetical protein [Amphritea sp. 1_MG-2023]MDO6565285.1 hypothetical protein [Amphritea sp. 1_MG-2023]
MEEIAFTIQSDGKPVGIAEFGKYFYWLRACYVLALDEYHFSIEDDESDEIAVREMTKEELAESIIERAKYMSYDELKSVANRTLSPEEDLMLVDIYRRNPFETVLCGIGIALTAALIVSGGKFEFKVTGIKIEIPPIAEGIFKLRKALGRKQ